MIPVRRLWAAVILLLVLTAACTNRTRSTSTMGKHDYSGKPLTSILVVALIDDPNKKMFWENTVADRLRQSGLRTVATSISSFPNDRGLKLEDIVKYVKNQNIDGILATRLVDVSEKWAPGSPSPPSYNSGGGIISYGNFNTYYPAAYSSAYGQREGVTRTTVQLETSLYLSSTMELVWSMNSDTIDPGSITRLAASVSSNIIASLRKDGLL